MGVVWVATLFRRGAHDPGRRRMGSVPRQLGRGRAPRLLAPLRQTSRLLAGPRAANLCRLLAAAETDPASLEPACDALNAMTAHDKRAIWASYAALARAA